MDRRVRWSAQAAAAILLFALAGTAHAAEPPAGVVFDADVTVSVADAGGAALGGAGVTLLATLAGADTPLAEFEGQTEPDGTVAFSGVPRSDGTGAEVLLDVSATLAGEPTTDENGCVETPALTGTEPGVASTGNQTISIVASPVSSLECPPRAFLEGLVLGSDGGPIEIALARVSVVVLPDGGAQAFPFEIEADGTFAVELPGVVGASGDTVITVNVTSTTTRTEPDEDPACLRSYAEVGEWTHTLAPGDEVPFAEITTEETLVGTVCESIGTPAPTVAPSVEPSVLAPAATAVPAITLPPTDGRSAIGRSAAPSTAIGVAGASLAAAVTLAWVARRRRA